MGALIADECTPDSDRFEPSTVGTMFGSRAKPQGGECPRVAFAGLPWDIRSGISGAAVGPNVLRAVSQLYAYGLDSDRMRVSGWHSYRSDANLLSGVDLVDYGNVRGPHIADYDVLQDPIEAAVRLMSATGAFPVFIGGDHGLTLHILRAMSGLRLALVHVDAHDDFGSGEELNHGTFMRRVSKLDHIESILMAGVRGIGPGTRGNELKAAGIRVLTSYEWSDASVAAFVNAVPEVPVYVSLDVDALDPAFAPGTPTPRGSGLSSSQVNGLLQSLARCRQVVALDVMELSRPRHTYDLTPHYIVEILLHFLHEILTRPRPQSRKPC
jgi:arginase family enzyme